MKGVSGCDGRGADGGSAAADRARGADSHAGGAAAAGAGEAMDEAGHAGADRFHCGLRGHFDSCLHEGPVRMLTAAAGSQPGDQGGHEDAANHEFHEPERRELEQMPAGVGELDEGVAVRRHEADAAMLLQRVQRWRQRGKHGAEALFQRHTRGSA